jgi:CMP-N-acetylneuraminic acid synthetase
MNDNIEVSFFLPTRKGSSRVKDKNTRPFSDYKGGLFELKLSQLIKSKKIADIIISSNDPICLEIANDYVGKDNRIRIIERPDSLCLDSTNLSDLINYVPNITDLEHILWGHTTTPMANEKIYDEAISTYQEQLINGYDSLIGVHPFQNFLLDSSGNVFNNTTKIQWPRTQDLEVLYEINHAVFLTSKNNYIQNGNRVGRSPFLFEMDKLHSIDVDWEDDFLIAEAIYEKFK